MKRLIAAVVVLSALVSSADLVHRHEAGAGQTIEIGYGAAAQDPGHTGGRLTCYYDLHDGGVLKYASTTSSTIWNPIVATNGLAVIDLSAIKSANITLQGGIWTDGGKGWVRVKGPTLIGVGATTSGQLSATGPTDVLHVEFVDENDQPITGAVAYKTVNLQAVVTNCSWTIGRNETERLMGDGPVLAANPFEQYAQTLVVGSAAAVASDQTVKVKDGRTLMFHPTSVIFNDQSTAGIPRPFTVVENEERLTLSFPIELTKGSIVAFSNTAAAVTFGGAVTGDGQVVIDKNRTSDVLSGMIGVPVVVRTGATLTLANGASLARFEPADDSSVLKVGAGTASLSDFPPRIVVTGVGEDVSILNLTGDVTGKAIITDGTVSFTFGGSSDLPPGTMRTTFPDGRILYNFCGAGPTVDASEFETLPTPYDAYAAVDGKTYVNLAEGVNLRADADVAAAVRPQGGETVTLSLSNGTFTVGNPDAWKKNVDYWFDVSQTNLTRLVGEGFWADAGPHNCFAPGQPYIERVLDCRGDEGPFKLWNIRGYNDNPFTLNAVYPYLCEDETTGLHYLNFGVKNATASRRIPITTAGKTETSVPATLVTMVFGSHQGGGWALVGTKTGAFERSSTDVSAGIVQTKHKDVWVDGVKLDDPTASNTLNGGWQVISIDTSGLDVNGFGWIKAWNDKSTHGGQRYGEILIFTNAVSELTRCEAEAYLAKKWGIAAFSDAALKAARAADSTPVTTVDASGVGTIRAVGSAPLALGGNFAGTVVLGGGKLTVKDVPMPFTEETLPLENCVGWYDPDDAATRRRIRDFDPIPSAYSDEPDGLRLLYNRANPEPAADDAVLVGTGRRMPKAVLKALGYGPERIWADFDGTGGNGKNWRISKFDPTIDYANFGTVPTLKSTSVATGFVVIDSRRTLFTPIQTDVGGTGGDITARKDTDTAVWSELSSAKVRNGETRLNGRTVDQAKGFSKCPELLSFRPTSAVSAAVFGNYNDTDGKTTKDQALLMGETILYSTKLSDADTVRVEGYLMRKWLGLMPPTCVDVTGATVSGTGAVEVAEFAKAPKIDPAFVGTVSLAAAEASGVFEVTIDPETNAVVGGFVAPEASVALPASCTLNVKFTSRPTGAADKEWTVFACKELTSATNWTLSFEDDVNPNRVQFVQVGSTITVKSVGQGMLLLVR